ncbi:MAG: hypothetical protein ACD_20C00363G0001 [uncultured bacterium]|nr:MAG: hypothetical protein ACD_20C00363G0001 [uncultured bacterium]HBH18301.1 hypothetical protein [Cyanobacteria bacterium UBA9579]
MNKLLILLITATFGIYFSGPIYSQTLTPATHVEQNQEVKQINNLIEEFSKYSNEHNIDEIKGFYAPNYISGDGIKKDELTKIIKQSWDNYPDIHYTYEIKDIRVNNNLATVESYDKAISNTAKRSEITNDTGILESTSHNIIYLQKMGKGWKIVSDKIYYENTAIKYGCAKGLNIKFSAPEQIYSGEDYTASLYTDIPSKTIVFGSITREPIIYPESKAEEIFRQVPPESGILERVMKSNKTNNNELAVASVGFTEVAGTYGNPDLKLSGIAILLQRVNVIPKNNYVYVENPKPEDDMEDDTGILPVESPIEDSIED